MPKKFEKKEKTQKKETKETKKYTPKKSLLDEESYDIEDEDDYF